MEGYSQITNSIGNINNGFCQHKQIIDQGTDDELEIIGHRQKNKLKLCGLFLANVFTLGVMQLIFRWKPTWRLRLFYDECPLVKATHLLVKDYHGQTNVAFIKDEYLSSISPVELFSSVHDYHGSSERNIILQGSTKRCFTFQCLKYFWDPSNLFFIRLRGYDNNISCSDVYDKLHGLTEGEAIEKTMLYGSNLIDVQVKSYGSLLVDEVLNPFYIFQIASITLWSLDNYYYYACCIFIISLISIGVSLYETKKQMRTLRDMVSNSNSLSVTVQRPGKDAHELEDISASCLVPGDILVIPPHGCLMSCDAVLTAGNCIVNEAMLTGESVPETKTPLPKHGDGEIYNPAHHKRHTLFCGTQVIQTRYYGDALVTAVVIRTGFCTSKGELVRSILFPKPMGFKFYKDSMRFVLFLFCLAAMGMAYSLYLNISREAEVGETIKKVLDIITIVVPPALPAALTVGTVYAQSRLKAKGVFCISPPRIIVAGKAKLMCFDKTGTLTEDGLDLYGILPTRKNE